MIIRGNEKMTYTIYFDAHLTKETMQKADALYMDTIINAVTEAGFWKLFKYGLIECCGNFDGRKLYAI